MPNEARQAWSFWRKRGWVRATALPLTAKQNRGKGLSETGTSDTTLNRADEGQKGELTILERGICRLRSRSWMTFVQRTDKITPSDINCASLWQRWRDGSKSKGDWTSKLDVRKKEKNPTTETDRQPKKPGRMGQTALVSERCSARAPGLLEVSD